jgi:hypothetical protein
MLTLLHREMIIWRLRFWIYLTFPKFLFFPRALYFGFSLNNINIDVYSFLNNSKNMKENQLSIDGSRKPTWLLPSLLIGNVFSGYNIYRYSWLGWKAIPNEVCFILRVEHCCLLLLLWGVKSAGYQSSTPTFVFGCDSFVSANLSNVFRWERWHR